jgi:hypothetical protein
MEDYIDALITQVSDKAKVLRGKIIGPLKSSEFSGLCSRCEYQLDDILARLQYLSNDPDVKAKENNIIRIRLFRRVTRELSMLECSGIAALNRPNDDDVLLNKVLFQIHKEIKYPLNPPTVTCLSQNYYVVNPRIGLLQVPLAESDSFLHLPDLYHELGHPILSAKGDPKSELFQAEYAKFNNKVVTTYLSRLNAISRQNGPREYHTFQVNILAQSWIKYWSMEFFCDLFATYTLGPAYAWSHWYLTASNDADPYEVKINQVSSHPPDQARMEVILIALELLGQKTEANKIKDIWDNLLEVTGAKPTELYRKACPKDLLELAAVHSLEGVKAIGCRLADDKATGKVHEILNNAWNVFWLDPPKYRSWEKKQLNDLRKFYTEPSF